jgi:hypothetical protein
MTESFMEVNVVLNEEYHDCPVVPRAPCTNDDADDMVDPPADVTVCSKLLPPAELIGAGPNTPVRPPLVTNDPAAVITIDVNAPLHATINFQQ